MPPRSMVTAGGEGHLPILGVEPNRAPSAARRGGCHGCRDVRAKPFEGSVVAEVRDLGVHGGIEEAIGLLGRFEGRRQYRVQEGADGHRRARRSPIERGQLALRSEAAERLLPAREQAANDDGAYGGGVGWEEQRDSGAHGTELLAAHPGRDGQIRRR